MTTLILFALMCALAGALLGFMLCSWIRGPQSSESTLGSHRTRSWREPQRAGGVLAHGSSAAPVAGAPMPNIVDAAGNTYRNNTLSF